MEGLERIKVLASEIKDKAVLKIVDYLLSRNDMNEKYLNEEKSLKKMIDYIKSEAKKKAENGIAMLEDDEVYGLAIHYWDESNETLGIAKKEKEEVEEEPKEQPKVEEKKENKAKWVPEGQLTLFDCM